MRIVLVSSECVPFAKTGGLADVCGALPGELARLGHDVRVIMPAFRSVRESGLPIETADLALDVPIGGRIASGVVERTWIPDTEVPVYLIKSDHYFDRPQLYREAGEDYRDNCERFVFFCRGALETIRLLGEPVDLVHANDWQTGLIPAYLNLEYQRAPGFENVASLLTIHNMAYQGVFWHWDMVLTGLDWKYFNFRQMEFHGHLNLLKTGIVFADSINTVSPRYAEEIQSHPLGAGLESVLRQRSQVLSGILNGVDYSLWDPKTDRALAANYGPHNFVEGKAQCKAALQAELGLPQRPEVPLIGIVGRLADQKGFDLIASVLPTWAERNDAQWAILGTGEPVYEQLLRRLAADRPDRIAARLEYSNPLAHRIEAGADMFLMPSVYEPCGLNQLYSLKYGAVPIVRATGGLADTIEDGVNGFSFHHYTPEMLESTLERAIDCFRHDPPRWRELVSTGMRQDWSWNRSAQEYESLYRVTIERKKRRAVIA